MMGFQTCVECLVLLQVNLKFCTYVILHGEARPMKGTTLRFFTYVYKQCICMQDIYPIASP